MDIVKRIRLFIAALTLSVLGLVGMVTAPVFAQNDTPQSVVCDTLGAHKDCSATPSGSISVNHLISAIINIFSFIIGVTAVIMIMVGGFRYITAAGDSSKITSAKNTVIYAIVGLIIVAFAQVIVKFVLAKLT